MNIISKYFNTIIDIAIITAPSIKCKLDINIQHGYIIRYEHVHIIRYEHIDSNDIEGTGTQYEYGSKQK